MLRSRVLTVGLLSLGLTLSAAAQDAKSNRGTRQLPSGEALRGNCAGMTVTVKARIDRLRELQKKARKEEQGPPSSLFGGRPAVAASAKERDRLRALNAALQAKGCAPVNVEDELRNAPPTVKPKESSGSKK